MEKVHLQRDAEQRMTSGADEYVIATNDHSYEDTTTGGEGEGEGEGEGGTYETPETPQPAPYLVHTHTQKHTHTHTPYVFDVCSGNSGT